MTSDPPGSFCHPSLPVSPFVVLFLFLCPLPNVTRAGSNANHAESRLLEYYEPDIEPYESQLVSSRTTSADAEVEGVEEVASTPAPRSAGKAIFAFRKNGVRVDVRMVPAENASLRSNESSNADDRFPRFPVKDIGGCIFKLSLTCVGERLTLFLEAVGRLDEITILGEAVKLVRTRVPVRTVTDRRMVDASLAETIDRAIENFFETFSLRVTLPRVNGGEERSRIDVEFEEPAEPAEHQEGRNDLLEGRGKMGGGGGGKGNKGGGGGGGGKCKRMMMFMLMMIKMKMMGMIGLTAMKGMMMAGMSLMISKFMLIQKLMALKKGGVGGGGGGGAPWQSAGGGGGGTGPLKEIILVTKASGGSSAGGAGCCAGGPSDSYGAPPANSYGPPSGGADGYDYSGGGGGGGGGWGRSFKNGALGSSNEKPMIIGGNTTNENPEHSPDGVASRVPHRQSLGSAPLAFRYYENYRNTKRNSDTSKSTAVNASAPLQSSASINIQRISNFHDENVFNT